MGNLPIPRYFLIANMLRNRIISGTYPKGKLMSTEEQLSSELNVSRVTIRQSLKLLEEQGLIVRKQGVGTFVSDSVKLQPITFNGHIEDIMYQQMSTKVCDIKIKKMPPSKEKQEKLKLADGKKITKVERTRLLNGEIMSYVENFFPEKVAKFVKKEDVKDHSFVELFENYGFIQHNATQKIFAVPATAYVAKKLQIPKGAPVLFSEVIIYEPDGTPINLVNVYNHSERYNYTVNLYPY